MNDSNSSTFTDRIRGLMSGLLKPVAAGLHRLGVHPDAVTIVGLLMVFGAACLIATGNLQIGGLVLILALPLDAVDGALARARERTGQFGAVLDSSLDRYADGFIFASLSYYFAVNDRFDMLLLALAALLGSLLVSYVRARAEGVHVETKIGLFTRLERTVTILLLLLVPFLLEIGLVVLAIGTNFTALQRLWFVYRTLKNKENTQ
jgi:CDP-diacylglycerol--glycerol-3-phosphate 3-phosphatidyltransferase